MNKLFLLGVFLIWANEANAVAPCLASSPQFGNTASSIVSGEVIKKIQVQYAKENMADFCSRNMIQRYLNSKDKPPTNCESWPMEKLEVFTDGVFQSDTDELNTKGSWQPTLVGTKNSRTIGYDHFLKIGFKSFDDLETFLAKKVETPDNTIATTIAILNAYVVARPTKDVIAAFKETSMRTAACLKDAGDLKLATCLHAMDIIEDRMRISHGTAHDVMAMTNLPLWKDVFESRKYDEGLRISALKLLQRASSKKLDKSDNLFGDLQSSFVESGMNKLEAEEASWKILGIIANGGANTFQRTSGLEGGSQRSIALGSIANSIGFLDLKKSRLGLSLYSYPSNLITQCDNVKPYHFWMTAYLARELVKEGISPDDAATATYITQKAYQLKREIAYANNPNFKPYAILTRPAYDPAQQIVRTDLAFGSAGALFGSISRLQANSQIINVDLAVISLLQDSTPLPAITPEKARELNVLSAYDLWSTIFSPDSAFNAIRSQLK